MKANKIDVDPGIEFCQICHIFGNEELIEVEVIIPSVGSPSEQKILLCDECIDELWSIKNHDQ